MTLPDDMVATLQGHGLYVSGPWRDGARGWQARRAVSRSGPATDSGLLSQPLLWIYEEDGAWFLEKHESIPGPGPTDFCSQHTTAEDAVEQALRFFDSHRDRERG